MIVDRWDDTCGPTRLPTRWRRWPMQISRAIPGSSQRLTVLAGGTDFYPAQTARTAWLEATPRDVLDISDIAELEGVQGRGFGHDVRRAGHLDRHLQCRTPQRLRWIEACGTRGRWAQVQNRGTLAGNLCNASPAADGVPPLLALDAVVRIASVGGKASVPLAQFITGNRRTVLAPDELVTAVHIPRPDPGARSAFLKLGARSYLVISIASVAAVVTMRRGRMHCRRRPLPSAHARPCRNGWKCWSVI